MELLSVAISSESVPWVMLLPFSWTALTVGGFQELHNCCQNASKTSAAIVFFSFTPPRLGKACQFCQLQLLENQAGCLHS